MPTLQATLPAASASVPGPGVARKSRVATLPSVSATAPHGVAAKHWIASQAIPAGTVSAIQAVPAKHQVASLPVVHTEAFGAFPEPVITQGQWDAAESAAQRWPRKDIKVDWTRETYTGVVADLNDVVLSASVERSIVGELPAEAGMADGYATGEAEVDLVGRRRGAALNVASELTKWRADSPLYGQRLTTSPMYVEMGLITDAGQALERQFTGQVRDIEIDELAESVKITGLDPSERIRELVTLPTFAEFSNHAARRPYAFTVNTQWLVDFVLRQNGIYCSPPPRSDAIISCTGHGGLVAEIGFNGAPIGTPDLGYQAPQAGLWEDGSGHPFNMLGSPEPASAFPASCGYQELYAGAPDGITPPVKFQSGYSCGVAGWVHFGSWMTGSQSTEARLWQVRPTVNDYPRLFVNVSADGSVYAGLVNNDTNNTITGCPKIKASSDPWHMVGVHWYWTSNTAFTLTLRLDGTTYTYNLTHTAVTVTPTAFYDGYKANCQLRAYMLKSWTNLQMWATRPIPALADWQALENWTPQADVGRGLNELLYLPDISAQDSWDVLKAVVQAELGVHGFDPQGRYFFRQRTDSRAEDATVELDVKTNLQSVAHTLSSDGVRNVIGYTATPRYHDTLGKGPSSCTAVVEEQDIYQFQVPAGKKYTYTLDWPFGAAGWQGGVLTYYPQADSVPTNGIGFPSDSVRWSDDIQHGWTYSTKGASGAWTINDNVQSVVVRYAQVTARQVMVIVDNTDPTCTRDIIIATSATLGSTGTTDGQPGLRIGGWPLNTMPDHIEEYRNEDSIDFYSGPRAFDLEKTDWRQTPGVLAPVCQQLLEALAEEVPLLEDLPVRGNPKVQVGAIARATFRGDSAQPIYGSIVKTKRTLDSSGLNDLITLRPLPLQTLAPTGWSFFFDTSSYQFSQSNNPLNLTTMRNLGYAGIIAKIGQGGGVTMGGTTYGNTLDPDWATTRDAARALWPSTTAGYWFVGNVETPASQASRCAAAIGDLTIPVMLDWEDSGGNWANLLAVLSAFKTAGLKVTMLYCGSGYASNTTAATTGPPATGAGGGNPSTIDTDAKLNVIRARYWVNDAGNPRALFDDQPAARTFGLQDFNGAHPDAQQFTQYGVPYAGVQVDVDAFPGDATQLSNMMYGRTFTTTV